MTSWRGTFLSAVYLAPSSFWVALPQLMIKWSDSGLLSRGTARWLDLHPEQVSYEAVMDGPSGFETAWEVNPESLLHHVTRSTLIQVTLPFEWEDGSGELRMDLVVNPDNSVCLYLNAPYASIYEQHPRREGQSNIDRFVNAACMLFSPSVFSVGFIGEEAQLPGITEAEAWPDDWAFYGVGVAEDLFPLVTSLASQAQEIRYVEQGGLFVRWTRWEEHPTSPEAWRLALHQVQERYVSSLQ